MITWGFFLVKLEIKRVLAILEGMITDLQSVTRTPQSTQFYIFNLFADYVLPYNNGWAWTDDLLYLFDLLGLSERAVRTTLSRMRQHGWFETERSGRRSRYCLTAQGKSIIDEGGKRIFEAPLTHWDGTWHTVVYSLPEEKRSLRNVLRKKLLWFGFGRLAPGAWISPHDRRAELEVLVDELAVREHISLFASRNMEMVSNGELVARCWELADLQQDYATFVEKWQPELQDTTDQPLSADNEAVKARFLKRFQLTFDFQPFPRRDPNLPLNLLPADWQGHDARHIFRDLRVQLNQGLPAFMTGVLS